MSKTIHRPEYHVICQLIRQARVETGISQVSLAASLDRPQSFVSDVENGARRVDLLEVRDICRALGVDFLDLVRHIDEGLGARAHKKRPR